MRWTRLSFFYLIGYLTGGGLGLLAAPDLALDLLGARGSYPAPMVRLAGVLMLALAIIVFQIARLRIEALYSTTLIVRVPLIGVIGSLYLETRDPVFLILTGIIGLGMVFTGIGLVTDRRGRA